MPTGIERRVTVDVITTVDVKSTYTHDLQLQLMPPDGLDDLYRTDPAQPLTKTGEEPHTADDLQHETTVIRTYHIHRRSTIGFHPKISETPMWTTRLTLWIVNGDRRVTTN